MCERRVTIIDRHILFRVVRAYAFLMAALVVFFILLHYLEYVDDFLDRKAPLNQLYTRYYPSYVPEIVRLISPLALFLAVIYVTGSLAQSLQITALQTGGVSIFRLFSPYAALGVCVSVGMVLFNGYITPVTNQTVLRWDAMYLKDAPKQFDVNDIHRQNSPGSVVSVGYFDRNAQIAHRVVLQRYDYDGHLLERVDAQQMIWKDSVWTMPFATLRTFTASTEHRREAVGLDTTLQVFPRDLARTERDIETMTLPVAAGYVASLRRSGATNIGPAEVGYYTKYTYPFANLVVVLIAVPLAFRRRRGGQAVQIGLGLLFAFCYLTAQKLTEPFGYAGELHPIAVAVIPHAVFALVAAGMIVRARK